MALRMPRVPEVGESERFYEQLQMPCRGTWRFAFDTDPAPRAADLDEAWGSDPRLLRLTLGGLLCNRYASESATADTCVILEKR